MKKNIQLWVFQLLSRSHRPSYHNKQATSNREQILIFHLAFI